VGSGGEVLRKGPDELAKKPPLARGVVDGPRIDDDDRRIC
jgi:hypothetical protein